MKNYYEALGVAPTATAREIKKAYVALALKAHPDLAPESEREGARARYRKIQTAYWVLSDRELRTRFDRKYKRRLGTGDETMSRKERGDIAPTERAEMDRDAHKAEAALSRGETWEAAGILEKLVERAPGEAAWQRMYAQATARCGAYGRALEAADAAVIADPDMPESHVVRAEVLAASGNFGEAADACRHALELDPDHGPALELLKKASTLRVVLFRQKASLPLIIVSGLALVLLIVALVMKAAAE